MVILFCAILLDSLAGRSPFSDNRAAAGEFKDDLVIGVLLPLTGEKSADGRAAKRGIELAEPGLEAWGLSVKLENTRCAAEYGRASFRRLMRSDVDMIVGVLCPEVSEALRSQVSNTGKPFISFVSHGGEHEQGYITVKVIEPGGSLADYFVSSHENRFGSAPNRMSALAFDVLTATAIELRNSPSAISAFNRLKNAQYPGVSGLIEFR